MAVADKFKRILAEHLMVDLGKVIDGAHLIYDLGSDSLDCVELMMAAEEEFGITIEGAEAERIETVGDAVRLIEAKTAPQETTP